MRFHSCGWRYVSWRLTLGLLLALLIAIAGGLPVEASAPLNVLQTATTTPTRTPTITRTPTVTLTRAPGRFRSYLPLLLKPIPAPGAAILNAINNADGDANYIISWGPVARAQTYELQEDDNSSFSSPMRRYSGGETFYAVSGQAAGTWYYRVRGCNTSGCGGWSNVQSVNVTSCPFVDDFSNPSSGWPAGDALDYRVEYIGGEYRILVKQAPNHVILVASPGGRHTNYSVEVDGRFASAIQGDYGLLFGVNDGITNAYYFWVGGARDYGLDKEQSGRWTTLISRTVSSAINAGQASNHLRVVRNGAQITLYANGQLLTTLSDSSFIGSLRVGLAAFTHEQADVDVRFDNFRICSATWGVALMSAPLSESEVRSGDAGPRP